MAERLTYESVKKYVEDNSDCKLLSKEYKNNHQLLEFQCSCGNKFYTTLNRFKSNNKRHCDECGSKQEYDDKRHGIEYVRKFIEDNSDCKLLSEEYKNNRTLLKIQCKCGNVFYKRFDNIKSNINLLKCNSCLRKQKNNKGYIDAFERIKKFVADETDCELLSDNYEGAKGKLKFKCHCGKEFETTWNAFYSGKRQCNLCAKYHSKHELEIARILKSYNVKFIQEYRFEDCKYKRELPFDFYLPDYNTCIEYDGEFHYRKILGNDIKLQKMRDSIKDKYCGEHGIKLYRIPYMGIKNLESVITFILVNTEVRQ